MPEATSPAARVTPSPAQIEQLHLLLGGYKISQAIQVMAALGIADLLADGARDHADLARATGTHAPSLYRVLRFLAGVGLFDEVQPRHFALTQLGSGLRRDVPGTRRPWALMLDEGQWQAWGSLSHTVRTGEAAFRHVHGMGRFEYLRQHPDYAAVFQEAMAAEVEHVAIALSAAYDFCTFARLVDVGGGHGALLAGLLQRCHTARGVLFDLPETVAAAPALLEAAGVAERCDIIGGDFFVAVPTDGDVYVLSQVVHDWPDDQAVRILRNCGAAMREAGRLLVVERTLGPDLKRALRVLDTDMGMLVHVGGLERTAAEYGALFAEAGFQLADVAPLGGTSGFAVFEGVPMP